MNSLAANTLHKRFHVNIQLNLVMYYAIPFFKITKLINEIKS